jgi:hypothetical protein
MSRTGLWTPGGVEGYLGRGSRTISLADVAGARNGGTNTGTTKRTGGTFLYGFDLTFLQPTLDELRVRRACAYQSSVTPGVFLSNNEVG